MSFSAGLNSPLHPFLHPSVSCKLGGLNGGRVRVCPAQHCVLITPNYCLLAGCSYKQHPATQRPPAVSMMGPHHHKLSLLTPAHFHCRYHPHCTIRSYVQDGQFLYPKKTFIRQPSAPKYEMREAPVNRNL